MREATTGVQTRGRESFFHFLFEERANRKRKQQLSIRLLGILGGMEVEQERVSGLGGRVFVLWLRYIIRAA